jgi:hypothetical protein
MPRKTICNCEQSPYLWKDTRRLSGENQNSYKRRTSHLSIKASSSFFQAMFRLDTFYFLTLSTYRLLYSSLSTYFYFQGNICRKISYYRLVLKIAIESSFVNDLNVPYSGLATTVFSAMISTELSSIL